MGTKLISGEIQLFESDWILMGRPDNFKAVWQTYIWGLWVDGYHFANYPKIRLVYREVI